MRIGAYEALRPLAGVGIGQSFLGQRDEQPAVALTLLPAQLVQERRALPLLEALGGRLPEITAQPTGSYRLERQTGGSLLWVTPFGAGSTLASLFAARSGAALPGTWIIFSRLAALLARAHAADIHHLRLSPEQVVIDSDTQPNELQILPLHLGLVEVLASPSGSLNELGQIYMAPELRGGQASSVASRAACDVYSLGVMLIEALSAQPPASLQEAEAALRGSGALPIERVASLASLLHADPAQRPTALAVAEALQPLSQKQDSGGWRAQLAGHMHTVASPSSGRHALTSTRTPPAESSVEKRPGPGMRFGNFRLVRQIAEGGMGIVYEAEHLEIGHRAAVKVLHPEFAEDREQVQRFLNEARAVNIIRHPGLVEIFDRGQLADGTLYIVMEYLEGQSLRQWLAQSKTPPSIADVLGIGLQLARAAAASHEKGIIHRDLKPENIMLIPDPVRPGEKQVKVLDFGIAKLQKRSTPGNLAGRVKTEAGAVIGTPLYMAPEQFGHAESVNGAADVFALGVILYELVAGRMPYQSSSLKLLNNPIVPIRTINNKAPRKLAALIERMLSMAESGRPTMPQVADELARLEPRTSGGSRPLRYTLLGGGLVSLLLLGGYGLWGRPAPLSYDQARALAGRTLQAGARLGSLDQRSAAIAAIGKSRDPSQGGVVEPLLQEPALSAVSARALGNLGAVSAQAGLLRLVEGGADERTRMEAATALLQLSHPKGTAVLHSLLQSADHLTQIEAALRLLEHGDLAGAPLLRQLIASSSAAPERTLPVLTMLARLGDEEASRKLAGLAKSPSLANDPLLLFSLAKLGDESGRQRLRASTGAGAQAVLATRLLISLGECPQTAQQQLLSTLRDGRQPDATRQIAIEGLADCDRDEAVLPLARLLTDPSGQRLSFAAAAAILRLFVGQSAQLAERSLSFSHMALGSDSGATRELAVEMLGVLDAESTVPSLRQALRDSERDVRRGAAQALGRKLVRTALQALLDSLTDSDAEVRSTGMHSISQVVGGLRHRGDQQADGIVLGPLDRIAQGSDAADRIVASGVLVQLGQAQHRDALRAGATSNSPQLRRLAVDFIEEVSLLGEALADPDAQVRFAAAQRLALLGQASAKPVLRQALASPGIEGVLAYGLLRRLGEDIAEPPELIQRVIRSAPAERATLLALLPHLSPAVAQRLLRALSSDALASNRQRVAVMAFDLYAKTSDPAFRDVLIGLRDDASAAVQLTVAQLASKLPSREPGASSPAAVENTAAIRSEPPSSPADLGTLSDAATPPADAAATPPADAAATPPADAAADTSTAPATKAVESAAKVEALLQEARAAIRSKQYAQALGLCDRARRLLGRGASRSPALGEILWLTGTAQELRGQWREAMSAYTTFEALAPSQRSPEAAQAVSEASSRLKKKMGQIQIFTSRDGQCVLSDTYYLPAGEHIISLGHGQTRTVSVDAGLVTAVRQCE